MPGHGHCARNGWPINWGDCVRFLINGKHDEFE